MNKYDESPTLAVGLEFQKSCALQIKQLYFNPKPISFDAEKISSLRSST